MAKKKGIPSSISLTYIGELNSSSQENSNILDELMRKFQSAKRFLRERIFDGQDRKTAVTLAKPLFLPNSRYMRDAFLEAEASITSQKELLPTYLLQTKQKISTLEMKMEHLQQKSPKQELAKLKREQKILYIQSKLKKLIKKQRYYQHHIDQDTIPKIVDGSKKKLEQLKKGKITKEEWRDRRSNAIYSRGEKSKGGNENIKLTYLRDNLFEIAILNPLSNKKNDRLLFTVRFPDKACLPVVSYLTSGESYSIRIKRRKGQYKVHITLENNVQAQPDFTNGVAGMDINPNNLSVSIAYPNGNFRTSRVFWLHDINTVRANKRDWIIQQKLYEVMEWIQSFGVDTLAIENLKFLQRGGTLSFNRMAHNFSYSNVVKSLLSNAYKENIALVQVGAYYSSFIGKVKYQQMYGLSVHQSAAFVLARRGMGLEENLPQHLLLVLFAKEAKKGQKISGLFTHWKKAKKWYDDTVEELQKNDVKIRGKLFKEILDYKKPLLIPV